MTGGLKFETFKDGPARKALGKQALYIQSKFGIIVVAQELARRYGNQGIVTTSLNPGTLESPLYRHVDSPVQKFVAVRLRASFLHKEADFLAIRKFWPAPSISVLSPHSTWRLILTA